MRESKEDIENAILLLAEFLDQKDVYKALLLYSGRISTLKELVFSLFVNGYNNYFQKDDNLFNAFELLKRYAVELITGAVAFDEPKTNYVYKSRKVEEFDVSEFDISTGSNDVIGTYKVETSFENKL